MSLGLGLREGILAEVDGAAGLILLNLIASFHCNDLVGHSTIALLNLYHVSMF